MDAVILQIELQPGLNNWVRSIRISGSDMSHSPGHWVKLKKSRLTLVLIFSNIAVTDNTSDCSIREC